MKRFLSLMSYLLLAMTIQTASAQGNLWGTAMSGGTHDKGVIFKTNADGTGFSVQYNFTTYPVVGQNSTDIIQATNGKFYGMTWFGGTNGKGTLYEYDPVQKTYFTKVNLSSTLGAQPLGPLFQASNGKLYGMTNNGGTNNKGVLFEYDITTDTYTKKVDFDGLKAALPWYHSGLVEAANGKLYGTTSQGGASNYGVLFEYDPATGAFSKKVDLTFATGRMGIGRMVSHDGYLYGVMYAGGSGDQGALFKYDPVNDVYTNLLSFTGANGSNPFCSLTKGDNGKFYGTTLRGGNEGLGVIFEFDPSNNSMMVVHHFTSSTGKTPYAGLTLSPSGKLYGTTLEGGENDRGVLYEFNPALPAYQKIKDFDYTATGSSPYAGLTLSTDGNMYGTTTYGGMAGRGVFYSFKPTSNEFSPIFHFASAYSEGTNPKGRLTKANDGKFYGMTIEGGSYGTGTIYQFDPATGVHTRKFDLNSESGNYPNSHILQASNGKLYGMTTGGGQHDSGVLFEYDPATNSYVKKVEFDGSTQGKNPQSDLVQVSNGMLYGTTVNGGANSMGTVFKFDPSSGAFTKIYDFTSSSSGNPYGGLVLGSTGKLYGVTPYGGAANGGPVIFEIDPATDTFSKSADMDYSFGYFSMGTLVQASNGKMYGNTWMSGPSGIGSMFVFDPFTNTYSSVMNFTSAGGVTIVENMTEGAGGKLYGTANHGGSADKGTLFEFDPATNSYTSKHDFNGTDGSGPNCALIRDWDRLDQTITFSAIPQKTVGNAPFALAATATSGLPVSFTSSNPSVISISGNTATIVGPGTVTIRASQFGNANFNFAIDVMQTIVVSSVTVYVTNPSNNAVNRNVSLTVTALAVTGAKKYTIQLSPNSDFSGTPLEREGTRSLLFSGLDYNTKYYSRVKTDLNPGWGEVRSFTTIPYSYVSTPVNNASNINVNTTITATSLPGVATNAYTIQLGTNPDFTGETITKTGSRSQSFTGLAYGTQYYARVYTPLRAAPGDVTTFKTIAYPYVHKPAHFAENVSPNVSVAATTVPGATTYTIELSTNPDFSGTVISKSGGSTQSFTNLAYGTTYYSRVKTNLSLTLYGDIKSFSIISVENAAFIKKPLNESTNQSWSPLVEVSKVINASRYYVQVSTTSDFTSDVITKEGTVLTYTFGSLQYDTRYFARVRSNLSPNYGPASTFVTGNPQGWSFVTRPANNAVNIATTVDVYSNAVPGAKTYYIELNTSPTFSSPGILKQNNSRIINFAGLAAGTTYYTRVRTNLVGATSWGVTTNFTTALSAGRVAGESSDIIDGESNFEILLGENPYKKVLTFIVQSKNDEPVDVTLTDLNGHIVYKKQVITNTALRIEETHASGVYILSANTAQNLKATRVVHIE